MSDIYFSTVMTGVKFCYCQTDHVLTARIPEFWHHVCH